MCCYFTNLLDKLLGWALIEVDEENGLRRLSRSFYSKLSGLSRASSRKWSKNSWNFGEIWKIYEKTQWMWRINEQKGEYQRVGRSQYAWNEAYHQTVSRVLPPLNVNFSRYGSRSYLHGTTNSLLDSNMPSRKTSAASHYGVFLGNSWILIL